MRIACIHVPQFALQHATRIDPALRGAAVAVVGSGDHARERGVPIVQACSRAAWALGVRVGMTATAARALSGELELVPADTAGERETVRAVADTLLAITPAVDLGGRIGPGGAHQALYAEVPAKTRGHAFGERVVELLEGLGLTARVGIADDRFTAWVAAAYGPSGGEHRHGVDEAGVVAVPRGGSAAFLAPRPLALLAISPEVQHMLEALGITTLGQFAGLPAPSVARPFEADYQAIARGDSGALLRPYTPEAPIREELVVRAGNVLDSATGMSGPAAIATIARRLALRLAGRGRAAAHLELAVGDRQLEVSTGHTLAEPEQLARALAPALAESTTGSWRLRAVVAGEAVAGQVSSREQVEALPQAAAEPQRLDPLALVLSTSASLDLRAERRDSHRRTRRGKVRRSRPAPAAQSRLFERR